MKNNPKNILFNVHQQLYELYAEITHECAMGRLNRYEVNWILQTISSIESYIYENAKCSKS